MLDPLATYLTDHMAGAAGLVDMIRRLADRHDDSDLAAFFGDLLIEVRADQRTLEAIAARISDDRRPAKRAGGWLAEKASRVKLTDGPDEDRALVLLESLEVLALGISGKLSLWRALRALATTDARLEGIDFDALESRGLAQHGRVEGLRLRLAPAVLHPSDTTARF